MTSSKNLVFGLRLFYTIITLNFGPAAIVKLYRKTSSDDWWTSDDKRATSATALDEPVIKQHRQAYIEVSRLIDVKMRLFQGEAIKLFIFMYLMHM